MRDDLRDELKDADVPLVPGMATDRGRVLEVREDTVLLWDGAVVELPVDEPLPDLEDAGTYLVCIGFLCARTGLDPSSGALFYQSSDDGDEAWVLEGTDEVRTRDADTDDPLLALARGLKETV